MLFIPLFGIPYIVKFSGGLIGRIAGVVNNPNKGPFDSLRKKAEGVRDHKQEQARLRNHLGEFGDGKMGAIRKNTFGRYQQRRSRIDAIRQNTKKEAENAASGYIAERAVEDEAFAKQMAGGARYQGSHLDAAVRRVQAGGIAHEREESRKRVAAIQQRLLHDRVGIELDGNGSLDFSKGMGKTYADAAARGDHETMAAVINEAHKQGAFGRKATAEMLAGKAVTDASGSTTSSEAKAAQFELAQAVYGLNVPARSDIVKGETITKEMVDKDIQKAAGDPTKIGLAQSDVGKWKLKDVGALATEQKAALDGDVLRAAIKQGKITQPEAERIVTTNLKDKVENAELVKALEGIAFPGGAPPTPPSGGPTPPPTPPTPPPAGGGGTP